jgi:hypothetical protein
MKDEETTFLVGINVEDSRAAFRLLKPGII